MIPQPPFGPFYAFYDPKKMRQSRRSEQNGDARKRTFTPLEFPQFRIGAHKHRGMTREKSAEVASMANPQPDFVKCLGTRVANEVFGQSR